MKTIKSLTETPEKTVIAPSSPRGGSTERTEPSVSEASMTTTSENAVVDHPSSRHGGYTDRSREQFEDDTISDPPSLFESTTSPTTVRLEDVPDILEGPFDVDYLSIDTWFDRDIEPLETNCDTSDSKLPFKPPTLKRRRLNSICELPFNT